MFATIGTMKGGQGKSTVTEQVAAILGSKHEVAVLNLDSNDSFHDRFVLPDDRCPPMEGEEDFGLDDEPRWPHAHRLNRLLLADPQPDIDGHYLYRRVDLPNVGVLFHEYGTLSSLASQISSTAATRKLRALMEYLRANYDFVLVDTPPDFENKIVVEALLASDLVVPVMDLSTAGMKAVKQTLLTAVHTDLPVDGFVITPHHRFNESEPRRIDDEATRYAESHGLALMRIAQDVNVKKAQAAGTPLALYRPAELTRADGTHRFDTEPPRALAGFEQVAQWLVGLKAEGETERRARWNTRAGAILAELPSAGSDALVGAGSGN